MKPAAIGRILLWRGGSVWIGRGGEPADFHAHHAIQLTLAFPGGSVRLRRRGERWAAHAAAIVSAQQVHAFDARDQQVAVIFVEPESRYGQALRHRYRSAGIAALPVDALAAETAALAKAFAARACDAHLIALAQAAIATLCGGATPDNTVLDPRIEIAIERVRGHLDRAVKLGDIAAAVHLSPERFRHLFMTETGVRFRAYVLWLRLEIALAAYVQGRSLTDAAHAGGFSDSAHLSRTFKKMFGINAASVLTE
ncbi:MAG: helix-turn-helix transcriptional regulator [Steroidobacteraceae bacterium]